MKANSRVPLSLDQRASRRLKRLSARRLKAMPLFVAAGVADQVQPLPSLQAIKQQLCRWQQDVIKRILTKDLRCLQHAMHHRRLVIALVTPARLGELLTRRAIYPPTPEYTAVFWRRTYTTLVSPP